MCVRAPDKAVSPTRPLASAGDRESATPPDDSAAGSTGGLNGANYPPLYQPIESAELLERRRAVLGSSRLMYPERPPLHLVEGRDVFVVDAEGRRYLDAYNNVPVVGHGHPRVVEAIAAQAARLNTNTRYLHEAVVVAAEELIRRLPPGFDRLFFVNSGSEANDLAWRIARFATGRTGVVVTEASYFGVTADVAAFSPVMWGPAERPKHVAVVPSPDGYRKRPSRADPAFAAAHLATFEAAAQQLADAGIGFGATVVDSIYTSDGILDPPFDYLRAVAGSVRARGGLLICDEVQGGFGRIGERFWSFERAGVVPDLVTMGKPMGNGFPVGAIATRSELLDPFLASRAVFSTFGGNPVAASASLAVLAVLEDEGLLERAVATGAHLRCGLRELAARHPLIGDVRGAGLMTGVELVRPGELPEPHAEAARRLRNDLVERGVLVGSTGRDGNVLKIRPPLTFSREHVDLLLDALGASLNALGAELGGS